MNIHEARTFVARFVQGKYSKEEHESFLEWMNSASMDHVEAIANEFQKLQRQVSFTVKPSLAWVDQLESRLDASGGKLIPMGATRRSRTWMGWAAAAMLLVVAGAYFFMNKGVSYQEPENKAIATVTDAIVPGTDKALLTLADGTTMELSKAADGILGEQGSSLIRKVNNKELVYESSANSGQQEEIFNTITTPNGGQYQVVLPDQTKVWLNAGSSIRFPVAFTGNERRVAITGEVYFEVAKNPTKPFKAVIATELSPKGVTKGRGEVEVVGTHFNIMAYPNEPAIQTTLLKGSVKVVSEKASKVLKPGQQAKITNLSKTNDQLTVQDIPDAEELVAWKDGYFPGSTSDVLLRQIARWYSVELKSQGQLPVQAFEGRLPRKAGIEDVLKILNANGIKTELDKNKREILVIQ